MGAADARVLTREGAAVVITDVQDDLGSKVASSIGEKCVYLHQDVRDEDRWTAVVNETIDRFGRLDTLVNNAGLVRFGTIEELGYEDFRLQTEVMLNGAFLGCKAAIPHMSRDGSGSIVNMASVAAMKGISVIPAYSAAKAGIVAMTRSIAVHCREQGYRIRCNAIVPGAIATPMTQQAVSELPADSAGLEQSTDHGMGEPEDVANMVLYLASDEGRHITGTTITIDNGETMA
ncbi:short-chain dehydrogenase [Novosphingobium marinum]|nr:short-chain dehydrogenase [Novosphingobium marinum]